MGKIKFILKAVIFVELLIIITGIASMVLITGIYTDFSIMMNALLKYGVLWFAGGFISFLVSVKCLISSTKDPRFILDFLMIFFLILFAAMACMGLVTIIHLVNA